MPAQPPILEETVNAILAQLKTLLVSMSDPHNTLSRITIEREGFRVSPSGTPVGVSLVLNETHQTGKATLPVAGLTGLVGADGASLVTSDKG